MDGLSGERWTSIVGRERQQFGDTLLVARTDAIGEVETLLEIDSGLVRRQRP